MDSSVYMIQPIAYIQNGFEEKFGIPRQSGLIDSVRSEIIFEKAYRNPDAVRGLEAYTHIWLLWGFSEYQNKAYAPTVRPPRLGGNKRVGVFATRSPRRPNPIGLSCVRLERIEFRKELGPVLHVSGADLMNHSPIFDIKPYLPYADSHPEAAEGFGGAFKDYKLKVVCPEAAAAAIPPSLRTAVFDILKQDPRPAYQDDPNRIYGMSYSGFNIKFHVEGMTLYICGIDPL